MALWLFLGIKKHPHQKRVNIYKLNIFFIIILFFVGKNSFANDSQSEFISIINEFRDGYSSSFNELKINKLLLDRNKKLCDFFSDDTINWIGVIENISTNMEGKGILSIEVDKNIFIQTWNNAFSDIFDNTLIEVDSPLYNNLLEVNKGDKVQFSGSFIEDKNECFGTQNLTKNKKINKPEFTFVFKKVKVIK